MARLKSPNQPEEDVNDWSKYPMLTPKGVELIKKYITPRTLMGSGRFSTYKDYGDEGIFKIGYGSQKLKGKWLNFTDTATKKEIEEQLIVDLKEFSSLVEQYIFVRLNNNRKAAILSFAHSLGIASFKKCRLLDLINSSAPKAEIIREWSPYINTLWRSGGEAMIDRRRTELDLYYAADKEIPTLVYHKCEAKYCLLNLVETFNGAPNQIKAIEYLERKITNWDQSGEALRRFFRLWSEKPSGLASAPRPKNRILDDQ